MRAKHCRNRGRRPLAIARQERAERVSGLADHRAGREGSDATSLESESVENLGEPRPRERATTIGKLFFASRRRTLAIVSRRFRPRIDHEAHSRGQPRWPRWGEASITPIRRGKNIRPLDQPNVLGLGAHREDRLGGAAKRNRPANAIGVVPGMIGAPLDDQLDTQDADDRGDPRRRRSARFRARGPVSMCNSRKRRDVALRCALCDFARESPPMRQNRLRDRPLAAGFRVSQQFRRQSPGKDRASRRRRRRRTFGLLGEAVDHLKIVIERDPPARPTRAPPRARAGDARGTPSNRPPPGTVSECEPIHDDGPFAEIAPLTPPNQIGPAASIRTNEPPPRRSAAPGNARPSRKPRAVKARRV